MKMLVAMFYYTSHFFHREEITVGLDKIVFPNFFFQKISFCEYIVLYKDFVSIKDLN